MIRAHVEVPLTQGQIAIVDIDDYASVSQFRWCTKRGPRTQYASRRARTGERDTSHVTLHQFLTGWSETDHRNGDGLDNRRANLRMVNHAQNGANQRRPKNNRSGFKGVSWRKDVGSWASHIRVAGALKHLGMFRSAEEAARAYDRAAVAAWGEFASTNFPGKGE